MAEQTQAVAVVVPPEEKQGIEALVAKARALMVVSPDTFEEAALMLRDVKSSILRITDLFDPAIDAAHAAHKATLAARDSLVTPLKAVERTLKSSMGGWSQAQEAERRRKETEARKAIERAEEDRRLAEAEKLEKAGRPDLAERALEPPLDPTPQPDIRIPKTTPKVEGIKTGERWTAEVTDLAAFIRWVTENPVERLQYVSVQQSALNKLAAFWKHSLAVPGLKGVVEATIRAAGWK